MPCDSARANSKPRQLERLFVPSSIRIVESADSAASSADRSGDRNGRTASEGNGVSELMCHPGYVDEELMRAPTRLHLQRERELELLTGSEARDLLKQAGVELISYRELGTWKG